MGLDSFYIVLTVFCTLFAACLGSFANVVIYRVPKRLSIAWPPSTCPQCETRIKPYDNIPVLSWLLLRGKCRHCHQPISAQYPLIEGICAILGFFLCRQIFSPYLDLLLYDGVLWRLLVLFVGQMIFMTSCLILAVIDWKTTEIPPEIALPVAGLGVLVAVLLPDSWPFGVMLGNIEWIDAILGACIGGGLIVLIIGGYYLLTQRIGMGGGDIWMMAMIGAFLGWQCLPFIFMAASLQGIVIALVAILLGKKQQTETQQGLFRNAVVQELEADLLTPQNASETAELPASDEVSDGKLAVPFGPFMGLAAIEYVFVGKWLLPIVSGGALTPWGLIPF